MKKIQITKVNRNQLMVYLALIAVALIVGFSFIFVKIALKNASAVDVLTYRFTSATLVILCLSAFKVIQLPKLSLNQFWHLLLLSFFYPILFFSLQTIGLEYSSASEAGIIFALSPIITLLFAHFFLKEKTTTLQKIGVLISMLGVIYIFYHKKTDTVEKSMIGNILLLLSVISIVGYYMIGKKLMSQYTALNLTVIIVFVASFSFGITSIVMHSYTGEWASLIDPLTNGQFITSILYLGILSTLVTSLLTNYALSKIPASTVSIFNNLSPIIAVIGGVIVLDEQLYNYHIIGGIMVFLGVFATVFFKKK